MKTYPLKLKPVIKKTVWGGDRLPKKYGIGEAGESVAEAWILADREEGVNHIENGPARGLTLAEYREQIGKDNLYFGRSFPLLVKFIDAADKLSVQVHPDDDYAAEKGLDAGKTEMWYILDAQPGAELMLGLKSGVSIEELMHEVRTGDPEPLLEHISVKKGDCFFIPAGLVHAIGAGVTLAEVQQNSNTTYRLYDYNRTDKDGNKRPLHIEDAAACIRTGFDMTGITVNKVFPEKQGVIRTVLCRCDAFLSEKYALKEGASFRYRTENCMTHVACLSGNGTLVCDGVQYPLFAGDSYLVPASLRDFSVEAVQTAEVLVNQ